MQRTQAMSHPCLGHILACFNRLLSMTYALYLVLVYVCSDAAKRLPPAFHLRTASDVIGDKLLGISVGWCMRCFKGQGSPLVMMTPQRSSRFIVLTWLSSLLVYIPPFRVFIALAGGLPPNAAFTRCLPSPATVLTALGLYR